MKNQLGWTAGLCFLLTGICFSATTPAAQAQSPAVTPPPKVLRIGVEFPKLGLAPGTHAKAEGEFVQAFRDAHWPEHYLAMVSISGDPRVVYFHGYDSFAAFQKSHDDRVKNSSLMAALQNAAADDIKLLQSRYSVIYAYRDDLSMRAPVNMSEMRFMEITIFDIQPGHAHDFMALTKLYKQAVSNIPDAHWATFEQQYGPHGERYIVVSPLKSLAEVDQELMDDKNMGTAMSAEDKKKMDDLFASTVASVQTNLFALSPTMSYVPDSWRKAFPDFWGKK